ncbi:MAG: LytTR family DNA-binding domain-containing protein [Bacteroidales bacterium]
MIKKYLNQPYPFHVNKLKLIGSISLFIGFFMLIFQPFGLSKYAGPHKSLLCLGYGFVTMIVMIINIVLIQELLKKQFDYKRWTVIKQISWLAWIIFSIGIGNFVYTSIISSHWSWQAFVFFQFFTLAVGLIPIVVLTIINQNHLLAVNLKSAQEFNIALKTNTFNVGIELITLIADNEKDKFEIELSNLLYIESIGNYIEVNFVKDNQLKNLLLRSTLKRTESQLEDITSIIKCHRAFLVNSSKIDDVKGNSQGLKLKLIHTETEIPVSRNFSKSLKDKLKTLR